MPSSLTMFTSSMPGMVFTPSLLRVLCRRLSSVVVVLWLAFFFLRTGAQISLRLLTRIRPNFSQHTPPHGALAASADSTCHLCQPFAIHAAVSAAAVNYEGRRVGNLPTAAYVRLCTISDHQKERPRSGARSKADSTRHHSKAALLSPKCDMPREMWQHVSCI